MKKLICCTALMMLVACGGNDPQPDPQPTETKTTSEGVTKEETTVAKTAVGDIKVVEEKNTEAAMFRRDMDMLCTAPPAEVYTNVEASERDKALAQYWSKNIKSKEALTMFKEMGPMDSAQRHTRMKAAATKSGRTDCPYADQLYGKKTM